MQSAQRSGASNSRSTCSVEYDLRTTVVQGSFTRLDSPRVRSMGLQSPFRLMRPNAELDMSRATVTIGVSRTSIGTFPGSTASRTLSRRWRARQTAGVPCITKLGDVGEDAVESAIFGLFSSEIDNPT